MLIRAVIITSSNRMCMRRVSKGLACLRLGQQIVRRTSSDFKHVTRTDTLQIQLSLSFNKNSYSSLARDE